MKDEMDILKEVGSTAAAHGGIALSEILGKPIRLSLPALDIIPCTKVIKEIRLEGMVFTMQTQMMSGITGKVVFLLQEASAFRLIDLCYRRKTDDKEAGGFTEIGMSIIKEVGNIIISSYISSLSLFLKKLIIPSFPVLINAPVTEVLNTITAGYEEDFILVIEALFEQESEKIKGNFWLILTAESAEEIKSICKKMLQDLEQE